MRISDWSSDVCSSDLAGGTLSRRMMVMAVTLLPQPDSPTRPTVDPAGTSKETSSTTATRESTVAKLTVRFSTARSGAVAAAGFELVPTDAIRLSCAGLTRASPPPFAQVEAWIDGSSPAMKMEVVPMGLRGSVRRRHAQREEKRQGGKER